MSDEEKKVMPDYKTINLLQRKYRNWLRNTDYIVANAENIFNAEQVQETVAFRDALRKINREFPLEPNKWVEPTFPSFLKASDLN